MYFIRKNDVVVKSLDISNPQLKPHYTLHFEIFIAHK